MLVLYVIILALVGLGFWWLKRVRDIRAQFYHVDTGAPVAGSDLPPMMDYVRWGFEDRNTLAPFGDIELSFPLGFPGLVVSSPELLKELLGVQAGKIYGKGEFVIRGTEALAGRNNLFSLDGQPWQRQRHIMNGAFRPSFIDNSVPLVYRMAREMTDSWGTSDTVRGITNHMQALTLRIICAAALGGSGAVDLDRMSYLYKHLLFNTMLMMLPVPGLALVTRAEKKIHACADELTGMARAIIDAKKANPGPEDDGTSALELLLQASHETEGKLTDQEVLDNVKIFLFAGHETTASTLTTILCFLAEHPAILDRCVKEIKDIVGDGEPTADDIRKMKYLTCVMNESLRLFPPAWTINRSPHEDTVLGKHRVPKDAYIMINTLRLHRNPQYYPDPMEYKPERFWSETESPEKIADALEKQYLYLPFGGGPRICIGRMFAKMEVLVCLVAFLQRYRPAIPATYRYPPKNARVDFFTGTTITPKQAKVLTLVRA